MELYWWGIIILFILIVVAIIIIVSLNHGNVIDIINQLPSYRIYYPTNQTYFGLTNINILNRAPAAIPYPVGTQVWLPIVTLSKTPNLDRFTFVTQTSSFAELQANQKSVLLVNTIYNQTGIGYPVCSPTGGQGNCTNPTISKVGYIQITVTPPNPDEGFNVMIPTGGPNNSVVFTYTTVGENMFTLTTDNGMISVSEIGTPIFILKTNTKFKPAVFQLVPMT
ncbi:MAG TPA: hypothetical protein VLG50_07910 [Candidatus Saccharimonadales bacterium]|nr:hypothetical protein [Candidatus Saccharimonadales bacterium]